MPADASPPLDLDARLRRIWEAPAELGPAEDACGSTGGGDDLLESLVDAVSEDGRASWEGFCYDLGFEWGLFEFESLARQAGGDDPLPRWGSGRLMEAWWSAAADAGWGPWRPDFRYWKRGAVLVAAESRGRAADAVSTGLFAALFSAAARRPLAALPWVRESGGRWIVVAPDPRTIVGELSAPSDCGPTATPSEERGPLRLPIGFWKSLAAVLSEKYGSSAAEGLRRIGAGWGRRAALRFEQEFAARSDEGRAGAWDAPLAEVSAAWTAFFRRDGLFHLSMDFGRRDRGVVEALLAPLDASERGVLEASELGPIWEGFLGEFFTTFTEEALAARLFSAASSPRDRLALLSSAARLERAASSASTPEAFFAELLESEA